MKMAAAISLGLIVAGIACGPLSSASQAPEPPIPTVLEQATASPPAPTPTPAPPTDPPTIQAASGLGVSRSQLMAEFGDLRLEWGSVEAVEGRDEISGGTVDDLGLFTALYLIGPTDELDGVRLLIGLSFLNPAAEADRVLSYQKRLLAVVLPEWEDGPRWLEVAFAGSQIGDSYTTTFDGREVAMGIVEREDGAVMVGLEIHVLGWEP